MNLEEFYDKIGALAESFENRDLEEYLLAVYNNLLQAKEANPSLESILKIFHESFTSTPFEFDTTWLQITEAPDKNRMSRKFTHPAISVAVNKSNLSALEGLDFSFSVLKFQIAELHKMRDKRLENKYRYLGLPSESGNYWYNFDAFAILECGVRCMIDNNEEIGILDWSIVGEILENGRVYE